MRAIRRIAYKIWVGLGGGRRLISPSKLGPGPHDCAPASVYQVVPSSSTSTAFGYHGL